jgi:hypothetical protein
VPLALRKGRIAPRRAMMIQAEIIALALQSTNAIVAAFA